MPGITGIISKYPVEERAIDQMIAPMMHESFYGSGKYINKKLGLYSGWVYHEGSFCDCMPVWNETKDICLIFSGENFADQTEIMRLLERGHDYNSETASYLVHIYEEMGLKFIERLNGWFSGLLVDLRTQSIVLFNDRYGMHRIFVHENKDGLYFASEAKSLLAALPDLRRFDPKGVSEFLTCECTLGNQSLYRGINILPASAFWEFDRGEIKRRGTYFEVEQWTGQQQLNEDQFSYELVETLGKVVKRCSYNTLPVGVSITGGLDSRMIMACLDQIPERYPCYTFGSMYRDTFDVQIAREVAKACDQPHYTLVLNEEFLRDFQRYLERAAYISDGYIGMAGAAELYVNSLARNYAKVRLTGTYGGELLRGDRAFKCVFPKGEFISSELKPFLHEAQKTFHEIENTDPVTFALFRQAPSQGYGRLAIERSQLVMRTPFMDNDLVRLVYQAPRRLLLNKKISIDVVSHYKPSLLKIPTDRGFLSNSKPFKKFIRQLQRKALIKGEYLSSHGMPNWLATMSHYGIGQLLEKTFLGRDKFQHFRSWTQRHLSDYILDELLTGIKELDDFINYRQTSQMIHEHLQGKKNYLNEIDKLLTLVLANRAR